MTGEEIKGLRRALDLTARKLGEALGADQATVLAWEREELFPTRRHVDAMRALLAKAAGEGEEHGSRRAAPEGRDEQRERGEDGKTAADTGTTGKTAADTGTTGREEPSAGATGREKGGTNTTGREEQRTPGVDREMLRGLADPDVWRLFRKILAYPELRARVEGMAAKFEDPTGDT